MHKSDSEDRDDVWANIDAGAQMRRAVTGAMEDMFAGADTPEKVDEMADHAGREAWRGYVEGIERTVAQEANYARHNVELTDDGGLRTGESWHGTDYDPDGTYSNYANNLR